MIHAYPAIYLDRAMSTMGDIFDCGINDCGVEGERFVSMFVHSRACASLEKGEVSYVAGRSGMEIAAEIFEEISGRSPRMVSREVFSRSPEYWCGWAVCYYQWASCREYADIFRAVSWEELMALYPTLHEADVTKLAEVLEQRVCERFPETNLKRIRRAYGCTQRELAERSGVSLRSIQMYEQRGKDINRAQAESVFRLAGALGCRMEDLLERRMSEENRGVIS